MVNCNKLTVLENPAVVVYRQLWTIDGDTTTVTKCDMDVSLKGKMLGVNLGLTSNVTGVWDLVLKYKYNGTTYTKTYQLDLIAGKNTGITLDLEKTREGTYTFPELEWT